MAQQYADYTTSELRGMLSAASADQLSDPADVRAIADALTARREADAAQRAANAQALGLDSLPFVKLQRYAGAYSGSFLAGTLSDGRTIVQRAGSISVYSGPSPVGPCIDARMHGSVDWTLPVEIEGE